MIWNPLFWPRWAQGLALVAVGIVAFLAWDAWDDRAAIKQDRAERRAKITETVLDAERQANRNDMGRRVERDRQDTALETAIDQAVRDNPDEADLPAGPSVRATLRELRTQAAGSSDPAG